MPHLKQIQKRKLLLDTHVWFWLLEGKKVFNSYFLKGIEERSLSGVILISPISVWEIGMLVEKKRIELSVDRSEWVEKALSQPGFELANFTPTIAMESTRLPEGVHGDPADRILISTAKELHATLVTCDEKILEFRQERFINVYDPRV